MDEEFKDFTCPLPMDGYPEITLAHGGGGAHTRQLIETIFRPAFGNALLDSLHDGAVFDTGNKRLAFTTDSYVVKPLFFPDGDIGALSVFGTVNDLAMCGARALYLSVGFVVEEGFSVAELDRIARSMAAAAHRAEIKIVTGDTKVVERGKADGVYINTAGVGVVETETAVLPAAVKPGDAVLLSGDIGRHGIAVLASREGLAFETTIVSDAAPLTGPVMALIDAGVEVRCLRDLTRGGLATALIEIAKDGGHGIHIEEAAIPVAEEVRGACEILGFDPLYIANEGRFVAFVPETQAEHALAVLRAAPGSEGAGRIGRVTEDTPGLVCLQSKFGSARVLDLLSGEQLPRIC